MNVVYVSPEIEPFARTGGLGDVLGALPKSVAKLGHTVCLIMPLYKQVSRKEFSLLSTQITVAIPMQGKTSIGLVYSSYMPETRIPVYFIENAAYFERAEFYKDPATGQDYKDNCERFAFFSRAALEILKALGQPPDVLHAHDWQSALALTYLKTLYREDPFFLNALTVLTVHNLAYQGLFPKEDMPSTGLDWSYFNWKQLEYYGKINILKAGLAFSDIITTVSKRYAQEIQTPEFGRGLEGVLQERSKDLFGTVNGVDYNIWNPEKDKLIPSNYSLKNLSGKKVCKRHLQRKCGLTAPTRLRDKDVPIIGWIGRLTEQKGVDLLLEGWEELMGLDLQFVLLGKGDLQYEEALKAKASKYPGKASVNIGFDNRLSHEIEAGADMFLMPSKFEPCGLNQLYSLKYGTVPIVRHTGGLVDTVDEQVGFIFKSNSVEEMIAAIKKALGAYANPAQWIELMRRGMLQDWSWDKSAKEYVDLYQRGLKKKAAQ
ncbi:MAG TPA: glycogen synthase GlgA [Candidatus Hypogeohydataceae bacterium YC41]